MSLNRSDEFISQLGLKSAIIGAPMGGASEYKLASALSRSGVFGFIGTGGPAYTSIDWLVQQVAAVSAEGDLSKVGIGIGISRLSNDANLLGQLIALKPAAIWLSFGDPTPYVDSLKQAGILVFSQVNNLSEAMVAAKAGADVIVAQGIEAGGHTGDTSTLSSLLPMIRDYIASRDLIAPPFLVAAGGIVDGRSMLSAMVLGADAVVMGTRFALSTESVFKPRYKEAVLAISDAGDGTILTEYADIFQGKQHSHKGRCLANAIFNKDTLSSLTADEIQAYTESCLNAIENEEIAKEVIWSGQGASSIHSILPAGEIVTIILEELTELKSTICLSTRC